MTKAVFMSGTDTGLGKTVASAWLCHHWQADYWKPVQAGLEAPTDTQEVIRLAEMAPARVHKSRYDLVTPMSPHGAAEIDGVTIALDDFKIPATNQPLIIEGAGGLMVPLNRKDLVIDLIKHLNVPTILAVRSGLGTINHTLLSLEALRARDIACLGLVMIGEPSPTNLDALGHFGKIPILAELPYVNDLNPETIKSFPKPPPINALFADHGPDQKETS